MSRVERERERGRVIPFIPVKYLTMANLNMSVNNSIHFHFKGKMTKIKAKLTFRNNFKH